VLSQPGDHNFVSNSLPVHQHSAQYQQDKQGPVFNSVPFISNTAAAAELSQYAGHSPALTIIQNFTQSPSKLVNALTSPSELVTILPPTGPGPVELQTIPLPGDTGHLNLVTTLQQINQTYVNNDTKSRVNYLVQPTGLHPCAQLVVEAPQPHSEADDQRKSHQTKKGSFSEETISILKSWLFRNITHPYPTEEEKKELVCLTGLTMSQLNNWLINSRRRMLKRLLSTLEGDHANFNSRASKGGTAGLNTRYANMWINEGACGQAERGCDSQEKSEDET